MITANEAKKITDTKREEALQRLLVREKITLDAIEERVIMDAASKGLGEAYTSVTPSLPLESVKRITETLRENGYIVSMTGTHCFKICWV